MLSIQILSVQIDISWSKKLKTKRDQIERYIHTNTIEKKIEEMKHKSLQHFRMF